MDYLHQELTLGTADVVEVLIDHPANVMLLDPANYQAYRDRKPFRYQVGGYARTSPVRIPAPQAGEWHLIVDLGGGPGAVRAGILVRSDAE